MPPDCRPLETLGGAVVNTQPSGTDSVRKSEVETLIAFVIGICKVFQPLILRHFIPDLVASTVLPVSPDVIELGCDEQDGVVGGEP